MKRIRMNKVSLIFFFIVSSIISQNNTEVYLFDITKTTDGYELNNKLNISNNEGYDNHGVAPISWPRLAKPQRAHHASWAAVILNLL